MPELPSLSFSQLNNNRLSASIGSFALHHIYTWIENLRVVDIASRKSYKRSREVNNNLREIIAACTSSKQIFTFHAWTWREVHANVKQIRVFREVEIHVKLKCEWAFVFIDDSIAAYESPPCYVASFVKKTQLREEINVRSKVESVVAIFPFHLQIKSRAIDTRISSKRSIR